MILNSYLKMESCFHTEGFMLIKYIAQNLTKYQHTIYIVSYEFHFTSNIMSRFSSNISKHTRPGQKNNENSSLIYSSLYQIYQHTLSLSSFLSYLLCDLNSLTQGTLHNSRSCIAFDNLCVTFYLALSLLPHTLLGSFAGYISLRCLVHVKFFCHFFLVMLPRVFNCQLMLCRISVSYFSCCMFLLILSVCSIYFQPVEPHFRGLNFSLHSYLDKKLCVTRDCINRFLASMSLYFITFLFLNLFSLFLCIFGVLSHISLRVILHNQYRKYAEAVYSEVHSLQSTHSSVPFQHTCIVIVYEDLKKYITISRDYDLNKKTHSVVFIYLQIIFLPVLYYY